MKLFPAIKPYEQGFLRVSKEHEVYYEQSGNPRGKPVLFVHGGPGYWAPPKDRRWFDPKFYRIILFHQRGAGKSRPHNSLKDNTTWHLVADIERLREHLKVDRWLVFGGSWGSTLSLAYATKHTKRVKGLIIRGVFLGTQEENNWYYEGHGANHIFPDEWELFTKLAPGKNKIKTYYKLLTGKNKKKAEQAARAWSRWEDALLKLNYGSHTIEFDVAIATIECHYFVHGCFMPTDNYLEKQARKLRKTPLRIVQGRYDVLCPPSAAWKIKKAAKLKDKDCLFVTAGHSSSEPKIRNELLRATQEFKKYC